MIDFRAIAAVSGAQVSALAGADFAIKFQAETQRLVRYIKNASEADAENALGAALLDLRIKAFNEASDICLDNAIAIEDEDPDTAWKLQLLAEAIRQSAIPIPIEPDPL